MMIRSALYASVFACVMMTGFSGHATDFRVPDVSSNMEAARKKITVERRNGFHVMGGEKKQPQTNKQPPSSFTVDAKKSHVLQTIGGTSTDVRNSGFAVAPHNAGCGKNCAVNNSWNVLGTNTTGTLKKENRNMFYIPPEQGSFSGLADK